ncbi:MAG TPA: hypothetical protein VNB22_13530 [Pyrinomonadaceae bacterium]|jgi:hypothetical protein|nr:hypothetical protein [Pyrinomonadaceae bacterium]
MKKIITLSFLLVSFAFTATFASAQSYIPQQDRYNQNRRNDRNWRNNRGVRVVTQTRIVRQGWRTYRETIQIKYLPNGRTQTKVISRTRVR